MNIICRGMIGMSFEGSIHLSWICDLSHSLKQIVSVLDAQKLFDTDSPFLSCPVIISLQSHASYSEQEVYHHSILSSSKLLLISKFVLWGRGKRLSSDLRPIFIWVWRWGGMSKVVFNFWWTTTMPCITDSFLRRLMRHESQVTVNLKKSGLLCIWIGDVYSIAMC